MKKYLILVLFLVGLISFSYSELCQNCKAEIRRCIICNKYVTYLDKFEIIYLSYSLTKKKCLKTYKVYICKYDWDLYFENTIIEE